MFKRLFRFFGFILLMVFLSNRNSGFVGITIKKKLIFDQSAHISNIKKKKVLFQI